MAAAELTVDEYSLNSVSGRVRFTDGHTEFFKFHAEEGLPVDVPLRVATEPGRQIALYRLRTEPRLADVCADLERAQGPAARLSPELAAARRSPDASIGSVMLATLRPRRPRPPRPRSTSSSTTASPAAVGWNSGQ